MTLTTALKQFCFLILATSTVLSGNSALADISVDKAVIEFKPNGEYYTDIKVTNNADKKAYISVTVQEVIKPGQPDEKREDQEDPLMVATPPRLSIEGKQSYPVRLLNLDEEYQQERIYRVLVEPATGRIKAEQDTVQVLISYDILVIVRPEKMKVDILASRKGKTITFYNAGTTNVFLENGKQCDPKDNKKCQEVIGTRLYAGASWSTDLPFETDVEFALNNGVSAPSKTFNGKDSLPKSIPAPLKN